MVILHRHTIYQRIFSGSCKRWWHIITQISYYCSYTRRLSKIHSTEKTRTRRNPLNFTLPDTNSEFTPSKWRVVSILVSYLGCPLFSRGKLFTVSFRESGYFRQVFCGLSFPGKGVGLPQHDTSAWLYYLRRCCT